MRTVRQQKQQRAFAVMAVACPRTQANLGIGSSIFNALKARVETKRKVPEKLLAYHSVEKGGCATRPTRAHAPREACARCLLWLTLA